ncbi:62_t:CDS:2 [Acaulospora morrowiae]|uniref:62_t:CDS:1 n=1 Tax=Acaulospora morrowiae TaxID=94023 RepID=A0A9N9A0V1_9GLOM|nr:62_t:CDS:2 [Acaulospora morrowiae]
MSKNKTEEEGANEFGEFLNYDGVEGGTTVTEAHASTTLEISTQFTSLVTEPVVEEKAEADKDQNPEGEQPPSAEKENPEQTEHTDLGHANGNAEKKEDNEEEKKEGETEEVFEVEAILGHKKNKNGVKYHIKWKGYSVDDSTWENEGDVYAEELLEDYWLKHGNEQSEETSASPPKRKAGGRKRAAPQPISHKDSKKTRVSSKPRASRIKSDDDGAQALESWEDQVIAVETVTRDDKTGDLLVYLKWNNGETSRHPAKDVNMRCPQKMIKFYEQRLTFAPPAAHKS